MGGSNDQETKDYKGDCEIRWQHGVLFAAL